ncbi:MAG TPA: type II toxin-antitoxin system RelE/ParE family toxin [Candidatus Saccharimonadales bacterium]
MTYKLEISGKAKKDLQSLDSVVQKRIVKKLQFFLTQEDPLAFAKPLVNSKDGDYRWRIGHYRVVFDSNDSTILLLRVQHRGQVYKVQAA